MPATATSAAPASTPVSPAHAAQPAVPALGPSIALLSWNLHKGVDEGWQADLQQLGAGRDLLFLQEFTRSPAMLDQAKEGRNLYFTPGFTGATPSGVATLSSAAALGHCGLRASEPWLGTPKAASLTLHALIDGSTLLAVNMHGVNFTLGTAALRRQLNAVAPTLEAHDGPVILGGDLNAWSPARRALLQTFAHQHGLLEVRFEPDLRTRMPGLLPMDYLFFKGLQLHRASVVEVSSSDHNPLLAIWQLPEFTAQASAQASTADPSS